MSDYIFESAEMRLDRWALALLDRALIRRERTILAIILMGRISALLRESGAPPSNVGELAKGVEDLRRWEEWVERIRAEYRQLCGETEATGVRV